MAASHRLGGTFVPRQDSKEENPKRVHDLIIPVKVENANKDYDNRRALVSFTCNDTIVREAIRPTLSTTLKPAEGRSGALIYHFGYKFNATNDSFNLPSATRGSRRFITVAVNSRESSLGHKTVHMFSAYFATDEVLMESHYGKTMRTETKNLRDGWDLVLGFEAIKNLRPVLFGPDCKEAVTIPLQDESHGLNEPLWLDPKEHGAVKAFQRLCDDLEQDPTQALQQFVTR